MTDTDTRMLRVLHLEDDDIDSELVRHSIHRAGITAQVRRVKSGNDFVAALQAGGIDLVLSDYSLPGYDGMTALRVARELRPDLPFVFVSGTIGEERAVAAMKLGASDYVLKEHIVGRLPGTVERVLREANQRRQQEATERALAEVRQRMEFALQAAQVGVWEWDLRNGAVVWSELTEQLHGFQPGSFPGTFEAALDAMHPEDRAKLRDLVQRAKPGEAAVSIDYRIMRRNAPPRWVTSVGRIWRDERGRAVRASGISRDTTEQRSLEDQLQQAQRLESVGRLAAGIAHDFNNLLSVVLGYAELLTDRLTAMPDVLDDLAEMQHAVQSATALTRQLLAFSRKQILSPKVIDLNGVVRDTQKMLRRVVEENVNLVIECAPTPLAVKLDVTQMEQVLMNLVVNARDAMPDGGTITLATDRVEVAEGTTRVPHPGSDLPPGDYVRLRVSDTGTGIPAEIQGRLFEPFFTTKEPGRSTGLGLATVYGIVKQSGGQIFLSSQLGEGTTFEIYLPFSSESGGGVGQSASGTFGLNGQRVLVVEDQSSVRALISRMLRFANCEVLAAASAKEARQLLSNRSVQIDIVLTDVVLPGDSGYSLASWIRDQRPEIPVILMTGYSERAFDGQSGGSAGPMVLQKPFSREALVSAIQRCLAE